MKKILVVTDFDTNGSGYRTICAPLFTKLSEMGYDIIILGLANRGEEHNYPFTVLPTQSVEEVVAMTQNLMQLWNPDVILVAMDLPLQSNLYGQFSRFGKKYVCITPLENGPLLMDWAVPLFNMDSVFFISELGKQEAWKVGITKAEHLQIGADVDLWRPAHPEEKKKLREGLGIPDDAFVVLTVADNQERKNLWAGMRAVRYLKDAIQKPVRYVLVTREKNPFGFSLRSLAATENITQELMIFERGMPQRDLWGLYAVADAYLQPSKAEGLGLPVIDAMCCKVPVIATRTGAMTELLSNGRGFLVPGYEFDKDEDHFTDVWGNSHRVMIDIVHAATDLQDVASGMHLEEMLEAAYEYIKHRTWDISAKQLADKIEEICK